MHNGRTSLQELSPIHGDTYATGLALSESLSGIPSGDSYGTAYCQLLPLHRDGTIRKGPSTLHHQTTSLHRRHHWPQKAKQRSGEISVRQSSEAVFVSQACLVQRLNNEKYSVISSPIHQPLATCRGWSNTPWLATQV